MCWGCQLPAELHPPPGSEQTTCQSDCARLSATSPRVGWLQEDFCYRLHLQPVSQCQISRACRPGVPWLINGFDELLHCTVCVLPSHYVFITVLKGEISNSPLSAPRTFLYKQYYFLTCNTDGLCRKHETPPGVRKRINSLSDVICTLPPPPANRFCRHSFD
jgi:hypothetical protein